ncbi:flagellar motor switch protein FliM [Dactylosporangium sp. CA-233914]|uniref:flagellar motor switch protein FliM n=1 Tax=Dactylosporangium sp. CA-233914 TaxID=3239934 RepID=UPI003D916993
MTQSTSATGSGRTPGKMHRRGNKSSGPEPYDFRRPTKLSREHVRTLQIAYETFARQYSTLLTSSLRAVSSISLVSIEQLTYDEYISGLSSPTIVAMFTLDPLPGTAILEFSLSTAMACIDHMLGGPGGPQPQRALSDIETPLLHSLIERTLGELRYAFEGIVALRPQMTTIEYNPQFAQAGAASDPMIVSSFEMKVGAEECMATICLPFGSIFAKLQGERGEGVLTEAQRAAREAAYRNVVAGLESAPIEVSVRFQPVRMHPADLIGLQPGDVVPLAHSTSTPLAVVTADITFAYAVPGAQGNRMACLVVPSPQPGQGPTHRPAPAGQLGMKNRAEETSR